MLNPELLERLEKQRKHRTVKVYGKLHKLTEPETSTLRTLNRIDGTPLVRIDNTVLYLINQTL
jgi:hypothetical protein